MALCIGSYHQFGVNFFSYTVLYVAGEYLFTFICADNQSRSGSRISESEHSLHCDLFQFELNACGNCSKLTFNEKVTNLKASSKVKRGSNAVYGLKGIFKWKHATLFRSSGENCGKISDLY